MRIELKKLKVVAALSQETTAYTAIVLVDGARAFHAENRGHGGCDEFHAFKGYDGPGLATVNAWLKSNEPPEGPFEPDAAHRAPFDRGTPCDLEIFVMRWIAKADALRKLTRLLATSVLAIGSSGELFKFKAKPDPATIARLRASHPSDEIVNGAGGDVVERALGAFAGVGREADEVHTRQREGRLTHADATWLLAQDTRALRPCPDLAEHLNAFIREDDARFAAYQAQREAAR